MGRRRVAWCSNFRGTTTWRAPVTPTFPPAHPPFALSHIRSSPSRGNRSAGFPHSGVEKFPRAHNRDAAKSSEGEEVVVARHDEVGLCGHRTLQDAVIRLVGGDDRDALPRNDRLGEGLNECADTTRPRRGPLELANQDSLDLLEDRR